MTDEDRAAAKLLMEWATLTSLNEDMLSDHFRNHRLAAIAAATPEIERGALERAARVADADYWVHVDPTTAPRRIAQAIRNLAPE